jgi:hypothetical protein
VCTGQNCAACGGAGQPCCNGTSCGGGGCCDNNTGLCLGAGTACGAGANAGTCTNGGCQSGRCGRLGEPACPGGIGCTAPYTFEQNGNCVACGAQDQICCDNGNNGRYCGAGELCVNNGNGGRCQACGGMGQACCLGRTCATGACNGNNVCN